MHRQSNKGQFATASGLKPMVLPAKNSLKKSTFQRRDKDTFVLFKSLLSCIFLLLLATGHGLNTRVMGLSWNNWEAGLNASDPCSEV